MPHCVCGKCDPSGERFKAVYGFNPIKDEVAKRRRSHDEVVLEREQRKRIQAMKREARARYYMSRRKRAPKETT